MSPETRPWPAPTLILTGAAACVAGVAAGRLWQALPAARVGESLALVALAALLAWPVCSKATAGEAQWWHLPETAR